MTNLNARFPVVADQVQLSTASAAGDIVQNGVLIDGLSTVARAASSGGVVTQNGIRLTPTSQTQYVDATAGLPAGTTWQNGLPLAPDGSLCISSKGMVVYQNGLPRDTNGAICATGAASPPLIAALANYRQGGTYGKKVYFHGDSTTSAPSPIYADITGKFSAAYNTPGGIGDSLNIVNAGEIGVKLSAVLANTSVFTMNALIAAAPDLVVACFGINDVRDGTTSRAQLVTMLQSYVNTIHASLPNCNIILWTPNSFLSNDPTASGYIQPNISFAQAYTDIIWNAYNDVVGQWPTFVAHVDKQQVYGRVCAPGPTSLMQDVIHPDTNTGYQPSLPALATVMRPRGWPFTVAPTQDPFLAQTVLGINGDTTNDYTGRHVLTQLPVPGVIASGAGLVFSGGAALKVLDNLSDFLAGVGAAAKLTIDMQITPDLAHAQPNGIQYVLNNSNLNLGNTADTANTMNASGFGTTVLSSDTITKGSRTDWSICIGQGIYSTYRNGTRTNKAFVTADLNTGAGTLWIGQENSGWATVVFYGTLRLRYTIENRYNHAPTIATYPTLYPTT